MIYALTMMRPFSRTAIFSLIAMGAFSLVPTAGAQDIQGRESARRQMAARDARQLVQEARNAYKAGRYTQAVEHYRSALLTLPKAETPADKRFRTFVCRSLSDALIARAIDYRTVGRYDEAVAFLREALELAPDNKRAEVELLHTADPQRHNPALSPQHVGDVAEVNRLLELGYAQLDLAKFDDAEATFAAVVKIDPYNSAARQGQELVRRHKMTYYSSAREATRAKMLSDVDKQWEESVTGGAPADMATGGEFTASVDDEAQSACAARLAQMIIPQIAFDEATINEVMEVLQNQIKRFEASNPSSARPINLTSNFGAVNSEGYKRIMEQTVKLTLTDISVKELLDMLVTQLGITYYYTPTGVELSYSGRDFGPLMERTFNVPPHFFDKAESTDEEDAFEDEAPTGRMAIRRVNPVKSLKEMGISFPDGATARYSPSTRRLTVRNTSHNLAEIEELLNIPVGEERQIVLNVIAVEVSEDDLEQLGFDWMFNINLGHDQQLAGGSELASSATGLPFFEGNVGEQGKQDGMLATGGLRSGTRVFSGASSNLDNLIKAGSVENYRGAGASYSPGIFGIRGVWKAVDFTVMMRGLSQKKGVDLLHNPRLIFSPGRDEQVVFADVHEMFFPETWEAPEVTSVNLGGIERLNNNNDDNIRHNLQGTAAIGANPTDFVRFGMSEDGIGGIGTILQVHNAEISENGRFVTLSLTTTTNDFEGFINWGTPIQSALYSGTDEIKYLRLSPNYILQPMIKRYVENTKITVVPGSVIVMGGLKEASVVRFEDKVPVLGDLPLVGRLFRSEGEQKVRKALIYFAKVDVIDPTGRDVVTGERPSMATENL